MRAAEILADAFVEDPVMSYASPDSGKRLHANQNLFGSTIVHAKNANGGVVQIEHGASVWLPSSRIILSPIDILRAGLVPALARIGPSAVIRILRHEKACDPLLQPHLKPDAAYLWAIGILRAQHRKGLGGTLLEETLQQVRAQRVYRSMLLKTENRANLPLFQRHGFTVVLQERVEKTGLDVWLLSRAL